MLAVESKKLCSIFRRWQRILCVGFLLILINIVRGKNTGADPVVLLTDALNLALVGGSGGILPREILKSRTSEMRFPAF